MGKKQKKVTEQKQYSSKKNTANLNENSLNMENLLNVDMLNKLKSVAQAVKQEQADVKQKQAEHEAELKKAEQKRLENDFAYLLEQSDSRGHKYK